MFQKLSAAFIIVACMSFFGCSTMQYLDSSSNDDMEKFKASKSELWNEMKKLKQDNEASQNAIRQKQEEIDHLNAQVTNLKEGMDASRKEMEKLKAEVQQPEEAKKETAALIEKPIGAEEKPVVPEKEVSQVSAPEKNIEPKMLKIKVLSGNGKIASAKALSIKLTELGYNVENIGMAPRSDFAANTIYYTPDNKNDARRIATQLGDDTVVKPLTWSSTFHVIVVTGP